MLETAIYGIIIVLAVILCFVIARIALDARMSRWAKERGNKLLQKVASRRAVFTGYIDQCTAIYTLDDPLPYTSDCTKLYDAIQQANTNWFHPCSDLEDRLKIALDYCQPSQPGTNLIQWFFLSPFAWLREKRQIERAWSSLEMKDGLEKVRKEVDALNRITTNRIEALGAVHSRARNIINDADLLAEAGFPKKEYQADRQCVEQLLVEINPLWQVINDPRLEVKKEAVCRLEPQLDGLRARLANPQERVSQLANDFDTFTDQLSSLQATLNTLASHLQGPLSGLRESTDLRKSIDAEQRACQQFEEDKKSPSRAKLSVWMDQLDTHTAKVEKLDNQITSLLSTIDQIKNIPALQSRFRSLDNTLESLNRDPDLPLRFSIQADRLEDLESEARQLPRNTTSVAEITSASDALNRVVTQLREFEETLNKLKELHQRAKDLIPQNRALLLFDPLQYVDGIQQKVKESSFHPINLPGGYENLPAHAKEYEAIRQEVTLILEGIDESQLSKKFIDKLSDHFAELQKRNTSFVEMNEKIERRLKDLKREDNQASEMMGHGMDYFQSLIPEGKDITSLPISFRTLYSKGLDLNDDLKKNKDPYAAVTTSPSISDCSRSIEKWKNAVEREIETQIKTETERIKELDRDLESEIDRIPSATNQQHPIWWEDANDLHKKNGKLYFYSKDTEKQIQHLKVLWERKRRMDAILKIIQQGPGSLNPAPLGGKAISSKSTSSSSSRNSLDEHPGESQLDKIVVRIWKYDSLTMMGMGVLVAKKTVATCAHVVLGNPITEFPTARPVLRVRVDFPFINPQNDPRNFITADVILWGPAKGGKAYDFAGLSLHQLPPAGTQVASVADNTRIIGHTFSACYVPIDPKTRKSWQAKYTSGKITGIQPDKTYQLDSNPTENKIIPGYSGTPVWDENLHRVVGIITKCEMESSNKSAIMLAFGDINAKWETLCADHKTVVTD